MNSAIIAASRLRQPTNLFLNANLAFSLRDLELGATNAVRVRRTGGATPTERDFTFSEITNGTLATWVGVGNDGFVTIWYDQVGTNNMIQPISLSQPQLVENGVVILSDGKPIIKRTRDNVGMYSEYQPNVGTKQIFSVIQNTYLPLKQSILIGSKTDAADFMYAAQQGSTATTTSTITVVLSLERRNGAAFSYTDRNSLYIAFLNKSLLSLNANFSFLDNSLSLGYRANTGPITFGMYDMQELILFETPETVAPIETNINNYYSIY